MFADNRICANDRAVHDGGINPHQAAVADGTAMQGHMMGDGTIIPDDGRCRIANMEHDKILNIGSAANLDFVDFRPHHDIGEYGRALADPHLAIDQGGGVNEGRLVKNNFMAG